MILTAGYIHQKQWEHMYQKFKFLFECLVVFAAMVFSAPIFAQNYLIDRFDKFTERLSESCDFSQNFPDDIIFQLGGTTAALVCKDYGNRVKHYQTRILKQDPSLSCEHNNQLKFQTCENNKNACRAALIDLRGPAEQCRYQMVTTTKKDLRLKQQ